MQIVNSYKKTIGIIENEICYGVRTNYPNCNYSYNQTSISTCERLMNERLITNKLSKLLDNSFIEETKLIEIVKSEYNKIKWRFKLGGVRGSSLL